MAVSSPRNLLTLQLRLASFILMGMFRIVQMERCDDTFSVQRGNDSHVNNPGDVFTHPELPCAENCPCHSYKAVSESIAGQDRCLCRCLYDHQTFDFDNCRSREDFYPQNMTSNICQQFLFVGTSQPQQIQLMDLPQEQNGFLSPRVQVTPLPTNQSCRVVDEYFYQTSRTWVTLSTLQHSESHFFSIAARGQRFLKFRGSPLEVMRSCFSGLIIGLTITCDGPNTGVRCLAFKLNGNLSYDPSTGIAPCPQDSTTISSGSTSNADTTTTGMPITPTLTGTFGTATLVLTSKDSSTEQQTGIATNQQTQGTAWFTTTTTPAYTNGNDTGMMERHGNSIPAIVGGVCGAAVIFIIGGVAVFLLWRRKFRHNSPYTGKGNSRGVTMSSLQNGHPHPTEGTVDNEIYAGDDAGIVDNVIYEGGVGADGVFSNPGYADKTPQFKPRMDAPGAFVQPNPGATDKTPQPQRNMINDEPQYAQIVDDQYADPQKVRERKDKKNKKKAAKDKNYSNLKGPHERQPGANNSNSNHVYQGLTKGADYQSLRGPREHHQVRPSQEPKTSQDGHDYTSLTPGSSRPSAGTLSKEADYTVLEGPDSPGEETAAGPDYTTLDGPDSPGDESTSGPDYTVLDGPDSPGD